MARHDDSEEPENVIDVVQVVPGNATADEELPESPTTERLRDRRLLIAGVLVGLAVLGVIVARAVTAGGAHTPQAAPSSSAIATATATREAPPIRGPRNPDECADETCLHQGPDAEALNAVSTQFPGALLDSERTRLDARDGSLSYRRLVCTAGRLRIVIIVRPPRHGDRSSEGYHDDGSASTAYYEARLGDRHVIITVSVPVDSVQLDLLPLSRLGRDDRILSG